MPNRCIGLSRVLSRLSPRFEESGYRSPTVFMMAVLLVFTGLAGPVTLIGGQVSAASQAIATARQYAAAGRTKEAMTFLEPHRNGPEQLAVSAEAAAIRFRSQDYHAAAEEWRLVLSLDPKQPAARRNLLISLYRAGLNEAASELLAEIDSLGEHSARSIAVRGLLEARKGRIEEAMVDLAQAADLDPDDYFAPYERGQLLLAEDRAQEAVDDLREARRRNPESSSVAYNLGLALNRVGRKAEGRAELERYQLMLRTVNEQITRRRRAISLAQRAQQALEEGRNEEALRDLEEALALAPGDAGISRLLKQAHEGS